MSPISFYLASGGANVFQLFSNADGLGKVIVCGLMIASLVAWTVMIGKSLDLSRLRTLNIAFERRLKHGEALMAVRLRDPVNMGPYAVIVSEAQKASAEAPKTTGADADDLRMRFIENAMQRVVADQSIRYESKMVLLSSMVSGAPFLGLFGTVWGVMIAFSGMGESASASIQSLAPGVASALLATTCALIVAIPSVFGYNYLLTRAKIMISELENFASWTADRIELEFDMAERRRTSDAALRGDTPPAGQPMFAASAPLPPPAYAGAPLAAPVVETSAATVPPPEPAAPPPSAPTSPWAKPKQYSIRLDEDDD